MITARVECVEQGTALVDQAGTTMAEVGEAITQMDQATQQNAALVEEGAAAAESLKGQAQQLVSAVSVFKLGQGSETRAAAPAMQAATGARNHAPAERRSPDRAKNVTRPKFGATAANAKAPTPSDEASSRKTGTDDEWTSF